MTRRRIPRWGIAVLVVIVIAVVAAVSVVVIRDRADDTAGGRREREGGGGDLVLEPIEVPAGGRVEVAIPADVAGIGMLEGADGGVTVSVYGGAEDLTVVAAASTDAEGSQRIELAGQRCIVEPVDECTEDDVEDLAAEIEVTVTPLGKAASTGHFLEASPDRVVELDGVQVIDEELLVTLDTAAGVGARDRLDSFLADRSAVIVGELADLGMVQVVFPGVEPAQLPGLADEISGIDGVVVASLNIVSQPDGVGQTDPKGQMGGSTGTEPKPTESDDPPVVDGSALPSGEFDRREWNGTGTAWTSHLNLIEAPAAWLLEPTGGGGVKVAVLDSQIYAGHSDLAPNVVDDQFAGAPTRDWKQWHGTHVAGTVCGAPDGRGTLGVAFGCDLLPIDVAGGSVASYVEGLRDAADAGASVVNMSFSWGGYLRDDPRCDPNAEFVPAWWVADARELYLQVTRAINERTEDRGGMVLVTSSGNHCLPLERNYPKGIVAEDGIDNLLTVANVDQFGRLATTSDFSGSVPVEVAAGGTFRDRGGKEQGIESSVGGYSTPWSSVSAKWMAMQGTSMATPAVAGVAALVRAANPTLDAAAVVDCIVSSAQARTDVPHPTPPLDAADRSRPTSNDLLSSSIVDALGAVACARSKPGADEPLIPVTDPKQDSAVMMVLDVSGSMSGDKLEAAKEAINAQVGGVEDGSLVGVKVYPLGSQADDSGCSTGFNLVPLGANDPTSSSAIVRRLEANGDTPTGPALAAAAADLRALGVSSASIVLVSDGESNCGPDPCEVAQGLAATTGTDDLAVKIPTVGFQISETGQEELRCIAAATGSTYADAEDGDQLAEQAAKLSGPDLVVSVDAPGRIAEATETTITATVTSQGGTIARDVRLELAIDEDLLSSVTSPRVRVGNLPPGTTATARWTFTTPLELDDRALDYTVLVAGDNLRQDEAAADAQRVDETIEVAGQLGAEDLIGPLEGTDRVALVGDGWAAGTGSGPYGSGETAECRRSDLGVGAALWKEREVVACRDAFVADLTVSSDRRPAQLQDLAQRSDDEPVDAAVVSVGATDLGLTELLRRCTSAAEDCTTPADGGPDVIEEYVSRAGGLVHPLVDAYRAVDATVNAPDAVDRRSGVAPVVVLAYPRPTPLTTAGSARCAALLTPAELEVATAVVDALNAALRRAAAIVRAEGLPVYVVGKTAASFGDDHGLCAGSADTYVNGLELAIDGSAPAAGDVPSAEVEDDDAEQFLPNEIGYRAMTANLVAWSRGDPAAPKQADPGPRSELDLGTAPTGGGAVDLGGRDRVELQAGGTYELRADGFAGGSTVGFRLVGSGDLLGVGVADDDGSVAVSVQVPAQASLGDTAVVASGLDNEGLPMRLAVTAKVVAPVPWWSWALLVFGVVAAVAALALTVRARRREARPAAPRPA